MSDSPTSIDVLIFGGGVAGLWLLDELRRRNYAALLVENRALGHGQSITCQGIIHGGLKYMFDGNLTPSARIISEMPHFWRQCLAGAQQPDLQGVQLLNDCQYIWGTGSVKSRIFMTGSTLALRTKPVAIDRDQWPAALANVPGKVLRVDEQVLDPATLLARLAHLNQGRILATDPDRLPDFIHQNGPISAVRIHSKTDTLELRPRTLVFTAGEGNAALRQRAGLADPAMQRRPLHMVIARGNLPRLFGHCVGGPKPRLTVTTAAHSPERTIWLIGGQIAEDGVHMDPPQLLRHAKAELLACIPGLNLAGVQFTTYRIDRAEAPTTTGQKPDDVHILQDHNLLTAFPTKLALAPRLAARILELLPPPSFSIHHSSFINFPTPPVATPPWEAQAQWHTVP